MDDSSSRLAEGSRFGEYRILKFLGAGGMGEVYLAQDLRLKREVALKLLAPVVSNDPAYLARFEREAISAASLRHPNVCTIHETGTVDGRKFIAMEYCEGKTLREAIAGGPMKIVEVLHIAIQIAEALDQARKKNLIHRDIKSANIIVSPERHVKVLDFGLARQIPADPHSAETASQLTAEGAVLGTVAYMSPEQLLGKTVDHRSDIFSLGVVLYEMLTGRLPFRGATTTELMDAVLHKEPPPPTRYNDEVSEALARGVQKMLQKDRENRYQSVHEVLIDLRQIKGESATAVVLQSKPAATRPWVVIGLAAVLLVASLLWMRRPVKQEVPAISTVHEISSVIALPCKVYGDEELGYLTDAVPSTLSTHLAAIAGLETKLPPTSEDFKKLQGNVDRVSSLYGVNAFVLSTILAQSNRFVLNVQLVEAGGKRVMWSKEYEGSRDQYIELTRRAADGLRTAVRPSAVAVQTAPSLPASSEAELAYREGMHFSYRYNHQHRREDFDRALMAFERALQLDPKLANAAAEISNLHGFAIEAGEPTEERLREMELWARRALEIDVRCSRAWTALASVDYFTPNSDARRMLQYSLKAVAYSPRDAFVHQNLSIVMEAAGSTQLALHISLHASALDPLYLYPATNAAVKYFYLGRSGQGLDVVDHVLEIEPNMQMAVFCNALLLIDLGRIEQAKQWVNRMKAEIDAGRFPAFLYPVLVQNYQLQAGNRIQASQATNELWKIVIDPDASNWDRDAIVTFAVPYLARFGQKQKAFEMLNIALDKGYIPYYDWLYLNSDIKKLQDQPGFSRIRQASRTRFNELLREIDQARSRGEFPKYLEQPLAELLSQLPNT